LNINNLQSDTTSNFDDELTLFDIVEFLQDSWKTIVGFTVFGIATAGIFFWFTPKQFEGIAQIKMAQIAFPDDRNGFQGVNVEEPQQLLSRMAFPGSYSKEAIMRCGKADEKDADVALANELKFSIPKGVNGVVNIRLRTASKETSQACIDAIYQLIKTAQAQLTAPLIDETKKNLGINEEQLNRAIQIIVKADDSGAALSAVYLSTRDEIRYRLDQITTLQGALTKYDSLSTHLIAPIYVKSEPVFPQLHNSLLLGFLLGGFLGLLVAVVGNWYRSNWRVRHKALGS
jgi:hypothetical protein